MPDDIHLEPERAGFRREQKASVGSAVVTKLSDIVPPFPPKPRDDGPKPLERLTNRRQFLRVSKGKRYHTSAFTLQSALSGSDPAKPGARQARSDVSGKVSAETWCDTPPRFGITVTKKTGGAVARNRIRRRLNAALRCLSPLPARQGQDYVLVARREALEIPFAMLQESIAKALVRIGDARETANSAQADPPSFRGHRTAQNTKPRPPHKVRTGKAPQA